MHILRIDWHNLIQFSLLRLEGARESAYLRQVKWFKYYYYYYYAYNCYHTYNYNYTLQQGKGREKEEPHSGGEREGKVTVLVR